MENANIYSDFNMNQGLNSAESPRNIGTSETPDCENIIMRSAGGIEAAPGYTALTSTAIRADSTLRGGAVFSTELYGKTFLMLAYDNGTDTRVYAHDVLANVTTELLNTTDTNRLTSGLKVEFTQLSGRVYWSCTGETATYSWSGDTSSPASIFYAEDGVMPFDTNLLFSWMSRLGVAGTRNNVSEFSLSAYRDPKHWDTATPNSLGDRAFNAIPDASTDERITAVVPNAFGTLFILRQKSAYVVIGQSEADWIVQPITIDEGCIASKTALKGNNSIYYLSQHGLKIIKGVQESEEANRYDSLNTVTLTEGIKDKIKDYTNTQLSNAHAIMFNDTYRLNINGDVYVFDLKANKFQGALTDASVEGDIGRYFEINGSLYGAGLSDGKVYKLITGNSANGSAYTKSYSTKQIDFGEPRQLKNITGIRAFGEVDGDYNITCDVYLDGSATIAATISMDFKDITPAAYYVYETGTATGVGAGYLDDSGAAWTPNEYTGAYLGLSDGSSYQIISNTATRIVIDGTPTAGTYAVAPAAEMFYTDPDDSDEEWASAYATEVIRDAAGDRRIDLRGNSVRLVFHTDSADQWFRIDGFQIKFEILRHSSITTKF